MNKEIQLEIQSTLTKAQDRVKSLEKELMEAKERVEVLVEQTKCSHDNITVEGYIYTTISCEDCGFSMITLD